MKRLLSIVTLLVTLALTGQSQQVLWSRHFVMQPNPDSNFIYRNVANASFTNVVKNGNHLWASLEDGNLGKTYPSGGGYYTPSTVMVFNLLGDSLTYTNLNVYSGGFSQITRDILDTNSIWTSPRKADMTSLPSPYSLNLLRIDKNGNLTKQIEYGSPFFLFNPGALISTLDSCVVVVGSLNVDTRNTNRQDMFVAKFHINGQLKWLNTYNTHVPDVRTYSVNLVGQDSLVVTAFWGRSVFNTYIDKDGYVYDNKVIWNDPGRRLVDKMRLLPTPDRGYFLIGEAYYSWPTARTYWHKMDHNFNVQWSDSTFHSGLPDMMISSDHTFTMFLNNINGKRGGNNVTDTLFYVKRRLDRSIVTLSKWPYSSLALDVPTFYKGAVLTGNNSAIGVGAVMRPGFGYRAFPSIFRIFGVGEPYNPGPLSTGAATNVGAQAVISPNPLTAGWQLSGISPDAGTAATLTWYDAQGRSLGTESILPGVPQTQLPKGRGILFYRVVWQQQGLRSGTGRVVVE